jgi:ribosomal protein L27
MRALIPACALAVAMAVSASAQDSTVQSKTKVKADDARTVVMTGCLTQTGGTYVLAGATSATGEDLTIKSKVKTDVDKDETEVKARTRAEIEHDDDDAVGTSGITMMYELDPRAGVNLAAHVGHRVQISGVMLDPAKGDDDADVTIRQDTKVKNDDAPDARVKSKTKAELPRGAHQRLAVVSVKPMSGSCPS